jgi:hypothetical protein
MPIGRCRDEESQPGSLWCGNCRGAMSG